MLGGLGVGRQGGGGEAGEGRRDQRGNEPEPEPSRRAALDSQKQLQGVSGVCGWCWQLLFV